MSYVVLAPEIARSLSPVDKVDRGNAAEPVAFLPLTLVPSTPCLYGGGFTLAACVCSSFV